MLTTIMKSLFLPSSLLLLFVSKPCLAEPLVDEGETEILQCRNNPASRGLVSQILQAAGNDAGGPAWIVPFKEGFGEVFSSAANGNNLPGLPPPFTSEYEEFFQFFSSVLPPEYSDENGDLAGVTPDYDRVIADASSNPTAGYRNMIPGLFHIQEEISDWGYKKHAGFPLCLLTLTGRDPNQFSDTTTTTLFSTNLDQREEDGNGNNLQKRQYMSAITCDKLSFYEDHIDEALDGLVEDISDGTKPVLSSWFDRFVTLYIQMHFGGNANAPSFVRDYITRSAFILSDIGGSCNPTSNRFSFSGLVDEVCLATQVRKWVVKRREEIIANDEKDNLIYWWEQAGRDSDILIQEASHNVVAFSQYTNTLFMVLGAKIQGHIVFNNLYGGLDVAQTDFFQKFKDAKKSPIERLNVAREAYRLLLPNNLWISKLETADINNRDIPVASPDYKHDKVVHIPILVQALNDEFVAANGTTNSGTYDASRYSDFSENVCPFLKKKKKQLLTPEDFSVSPVDGETEIPFGHEEFFPVFESAEPTPQDAGTPINGPKYLPFGMGYRRCPGEALNMMFMEKVLEKLGDFEFELRGGLPNIISPRGVPSSSEEFTTTAIPAGTVRRSDNIYVSSVQSSTSSGSSSDSTSQD